MEKTVPHKGRARGWRVVRGILIALGCLVAFVVLLLCGITWWLTPERLTRIVNEEASESLNADVRTSNVHFTIWSTFPHLRIGMDSVNIRSRNFDSIPAHLRRRLPPGADFLLSTGKLQGGINLASLFSGEIRLRDVQADSLRVNLVSLTESINNYDIIPSDGRPSEIPYIYVNRLALTGSGSISWLSVPASTKAVISLGEAGLTHQQEKNVYKLRLLGKVTVSAGKLTVLDKFPFELDGDVHLRFHPFGISTDNYDVNLGNTRGQMAMDVDAGGDMSINNFSYHVDNCTFNDIASLLPAGEYPELQRVKADLNITASARLTTPYRFSSAYLPSFEVDFSVPEGKVSYTLNDGHTYTARKLGLDGKLLFDGENPKLTSIEIPRFYVSGEGITLNLSGSATDLLGNPRIEASLRGVSDLVRTSRAIPELLPYHLRGRAEVDADASFTLRGSDIIGTMLALRVSGDSLSASNDGVTAAVTGLSLRTVQRYTDALTISSLTHTPLDVRIDARSAMMRDTRGDRLAARGLSLHVSFNKRGNKISYPQPEIPAKWIADSATLRDIKHSPEFLIADLPEKVKDILLSCDASTDIRIASGSIKLPEYPAATFFSGLDLSASLDTLALRSIDIRSQETRARFSANAGNIRRFLCSDSPVPLRMKINAALDTVQINQLARTFAGGKRGRSYLDNDSVTPAELRDDSISRIIPRNLYADIHATAMQTRYINLHLYNLFTGIRVADGKASVDSLGISADFGRALLKASYDTSDIERLGVKLNLGILDVDVVRFFQNFHTLLLMMPEMKNLSGTVSAKADGRVLMFPDMFLNVPSAWADIHVYGDGLTVHQNKFIRHLARMLMIPERGDLHIANMDVHAAIRDNLLELFPFDFEVSRYLLRMEGLNNFNGDMFYHIGVRKWPLHIPFGINIKGTYHHPVLRFGGKNWKSERATEITAGVMDYNRINIVGLARKYIREFIRTAAEYKGD